MRKKMLQLACGTLALLFALTGCGSAPGGQPTKTKERNLPTAPAMQESAPTEMAREPGKHPRKELAKTAYDDSLIGQAYEASGQETASWNQEYSYTVEIPELLSQTEAAQALNRELMEVYGTEATAAPDPDTVKSSIGWESHWAGSLLSLEMVVDQWDGSRHHEIYYYDFAKEARLASREVLASMGLDRDTLEPLLLRAAMQTHDRAMQGQNVEYNSSAAASALALRAASALAVRDPRLPLYPNGDGTLSVYLNLAAYTGSGWEQVKCRVDPGEKFTPLSADYEFITAAVDENGGVTVEYHDGGQEFSGADYQRIYGFAFDRPYPVEGCFGRYRRLFLGNLGSGFEPYLFLLTEDGTLEYVDLFRCARYGIYACGGPLYGIANVTELVNGLAEREEYSYATVYAGNVSGERQDLMEAVYRSQGLPEELAKTFYVGGGEAGWLSLDGAEGIQAQGLDGKRYTGFPLGLGMSGKGLIYALDFWDESGQEMLTICALIPGNGTLVMEQLAGTGPFGLQPGDTLYLFESPV